MISRKVGSVTAALSIVACTPKPQIASEPTPATETPAASTLGARTSWTINPVARETAYEMTETLLVLDQAGTKQTASSQQIVQFTVSPDARNPWESFSIKITTVRGSASSQGSENSLPASASGSWTKAAVTAQLENATTCRNTAASVIPATMPVLIQPPHIISIGAQWTDSVSSSACAGAIPLKSRSQRTYRVVRETTIGQQKGIVVDQVDTTTFSGEGADEQHYVRITGEGTGKGQLIIDAQDGTIIQAHIDSRSRITVSASGRNQTFEQQLRKEISRTN